MRGRTRDAPTEASISLDAPRREQCLSASHLVRLVRLEPWELGLLVLARETTSIACNLLPPYTALIAVKLRLEGSCGADGNGAGSEIFAKRRDICFRRRGVRQRLDHAGDVECLDPRTNDHDRREGRCHVPSRRKDDCRAPGAENRKVAAVVA